MCYVLTFGCRFVNANELKANVLGGGAELWNSTLPGRPHAGVHREKERTMHWGRNEDGRNFSSVSTNLWACSGRYGALAIASLAGIKTGRPHQLRRVGIQILSSADVCVSVDKKILGTLINFMLCVELPWLGWDIVFRLYILNHCEGTRSSLIGILSLSDALMPVTVWVRNEWTGLQSVFWFN